MSIFDVFCKFASHQLSWTTNLSLSLHKYTLQLFVYKHTHTHKMVKNCCFWFSLLFQFLINHASASDNELYLQQMRNLLETPAKQFQLHKLKYPTAPRCNDGSPSGYYLQKSNSKNWIIYSAQD